MKKIIPLSLILTLLAVLISGCGTGGKVNAAENDKISVVTTIFPQYDFTRQIAGDNIELKLLLPPGMESHSYEPSPRDINDIGSCDIFIYVGGESEKWVENILSSIDTDDMTVIALTDCVELLEEDLGEEHDHDESEHIDHSHKEYDEHVWTSPKNAMLIVREIADALAETDPSNASIYEENEAAYLQKLEELDREFESVTENSTQKTIIVGDRFPFRYLTEAYGLDYYAAFPGCASDAEPSAGTIGFLIETIKNKGIPVVFCMELSNEKIADTLCESTGAKKLTLHSCHSISKADFEAGTTYIDLMYKNAEALKEALM